MSPQDFVTRDAIDRLCALADLPLPAERRARLAPMLSGLAAAARLDEGHRLIDREGASRLPPFINSRRTRMSPARTSPRQSALVSIALG